MRDIDLVGRTVDGAYGRGAGDVDRHREALHRPDGMLGRAQRQQEVDQSAVLLQQLGVADLHGALSARGHGKDAGLKQVAAQVFQQGRIPAAAHDLLIDTARLLLADEPAGHLPAPGQQGQAADRGAFRDGEDHLRLHRCGRGILEHLRDGDFGRLVLNIGVDLHRADAAVGAHGHRLGYGQSRPAGIHNHDLRQAGQQEKGEEREQSSKHGASTRGMPLGEESFHAA